MNWKKFNYCLTGIIILLALSFYTIKTSGQAKSQEDTTETNLLQKVRTAFNQNNEHQFYEAIGNYRKYLLGEGNMNGYYLCWKNEVLYDVNHNHFYRALRKTMKMQAEMERRGDMNELYKTTQLRGIIYSLRGNMPLAHQYFEKALEQVDHSQVKNLASIYMDLANIEMDTQPEEAMKHLDCAIEIIKGDAVSYDYSDAIGFKVIVSYAMRDWTAVNAAFKEYISLREKLGEEFSTTYYYYALICKAAADKRYDDAIRLTHNLTNSTDIYKFQSEIYEMSGNTDKAFKTQKHYMAIKDSVNNVIMAEEMMGSASDLEDAEAFSNMMAKHNTRLQYAISAVVFGFLMIGLLIYRMNKNRYLRKLQRQNQELLIARDKAQEANRMKISFLRNMSHEIRTPLNIISGYAQIISDPRTLTSDAERADIDTYLVKEDVEEFFFICERNPQRVRVVGKAYLVWVVHRTAESISIGQCKVLCSHLSNFTKITFLICPRLYYQATSRVSCIVLAHCPRTLWYICHQNRLCSSVLCRMSLCAVR